MINGVASCICIIKYTVRSCCGQNQDLDDVISATNTDLSAGILPLERLCSVLNDFFDSLQKTLSNGEIGKIAHNGNESSPGKHLKRRGSENEKQFTLFRDNLVCTCWILVRFKFQVPQDLGFLLLAILRFIWLFHFLSIYFSKKLDKRFVAGVLLVILLLRPTLCSSDASSVFTNFPAFQTQ